MTTPSAVCPLPRKGRVRSCSFLLHGDSHPGLLSAEGEAQAGGRGGLWWPTPRVSCDIPVGMRLRPHPCAVSRGHSLPEPQAPRLPGAVHGTQRGRGREGRVQTPECSRGPSVRHPQGLPRALPALPGVCGRRPLGADAVTRAQTPPPSLCLGVTAPGPQLPPPRQPSSTLWHSEHEPVWCVFALHLLRPRAQGASVSPGHRAGTTALVRGSRAGAGRSRGLSPSFLSRSPAPSRLTSVARGRDRAGSRFLRSPAGRSVFRPMSSDDSHVTWLSRRREISQIVGCFPLALLILRLFLPLFPPFLHFTGHDS